MVCTGGQRLISNTASMRGPIQSEDVATQPSNPLLPCSRHVHGEAACPMSTEDEFIRIANETAQQLQATR